MALILFTVNDSLAVAVVEKALAKVATDGPAPFTGRLPIDPLIYAHRHSYQIRDNPFWR